MAAKDQTASKASRSWDQYLVKAVFDASAPDWPKRSEAEIRTYEQELNREYECQLFALPSPIAVSGDLKRIINVSVGAMNFRIYPPFALNEKKHASGSFVEVASPEDVGLVGKNPKLTMETYLAAGKTVLEEYVASIPHGEWPKLMMMTLNRTTD